MNGHRARRKPGCDDPDHPRDFIDCQDCEREVHILNTRTGEGCCGHTFALALNDPVALARAAAMLREGLDRLEAKEQNES